MILGYIGVGDMGGPMAHNLLKAGFEVVVFDSQQDRVDSLVDAGAVGESSAREVADKAEVVMVCLNTIGAAHAVAKEVAAGSAVKTYVDMSTTGPSVAKDVRAHHHQLETFVAALADPNQIHTCVPELVVAGYEC